MLINLLVIIALLTLSGIYAGLTLAMFSLRLTDLERKMKLGDKEAERIYQIRKRGNLLLCALLLGNVTSYSVMAIYLGSLTSGIVASIIATSLIFVFGEILPQAVFPRFAFKVASIFKVLVWFTIILFYPVAAPVAWILDKLLGEEPPVLWSKKELGEIIRYHKEYGDGIIDTEEERIVLGALSFSDKNVEFSMIPKEKVYYLKEETILDHQLLEEIREKSFSRIPVTDAYGSHVTGILFSKDLIGVKLTELKTVADMCDRESVILVEGTMELDDLMQLLIKQKMYMAIVRNPQNEFLGVVTMEDVFEEILKVELEDKEI